MVPLQCRWSVLAKALHFAHELCRMGWTFAQDCANTRWRRRERRNQVSEVLDWHFRAVGQGIVCWVDLMWQGISRVCLHDYLALFWLSGSLSKSFDFASGKRMACSFFPVVSNLKENTKFNFPIAAPVLCKRRVQLAALWAAFTCSRPHQWNHRDFRNL